MASGIDWTVFCREIDRLPTSTLRETARLLKDEKAFEALTDGNLIQIGNGAGVEIGRKFFFLQNFDGRTVRLILETAQSEGREKVLKKVAAILRERS